jgi:programmed cell death protein 5
MDEQHKDVQARPGSQDEPSKQRAMRENVMRVALTSEARQRLANIRMVKPEVAHAIEEYIIQMVSTGRLKRTIDDDQLKELLSTIQGQGKREFKIRRI